ncbi:hypothetical protein BROUX41_003102 [Berkeleyomyces rouxiae]|uniref:uncharacterized protein n=1 Tax=Berkeleyomyces rouxiae TaxID=2035830 RepID=UPI003B791194
MFGNQSYHGLAANSNNGFGQSFGGAGFSASQSPFGKPTYTAPSATNPAAATTTTTATATTTATPAATSLDSRLNSQPSQNDNAETPTYKSPKDLTVDDVTELLKLVTIRKQLSRFDSYVDWQHTLKTMTTVFGCEFSDMDKYCSPHVQVSLTNFIRLTCTDELLDHVRTCHLPGETVEALRTAAVGGVDGARRTFNERLESFKYSGSESLSEMLDRYILFVSHASVLGFEVSDETKVIQICKLVLTQHAELKPTLALLKVLTPKEKQYEKLLEFLREPDLVERSTKHQVYL